MERIVVKGFKFEPLTTAPAAAKPTASPAPLAPRPAARSRSAVVDTVIAEAAGEGAKGMQAVAGVIKNRAEKRGLDPDQVVKQPKQFTGYEHPGKGAQAAQRDPRVRAEAEQIVDGVMTGSLPDITGGADHYHANYVKPGWAGGLKKTATIGQHEFYSSGGGKAKGKQARTSDGRLTPNWANAERLGNPADPTWQKHNLTTIEPVKGQKWTVYKPAAAAFDGLIKDLAAQGYNVKSSGGYNYRNIRGSNKLSQHAFGTAIDLNAAENPLGGGKSNLPSNIRELAAKHGLVWGGDFKGRKDPMHFEYAGAVGDNSIDYGTTGSVTKGPNGMARIIVNKDTEIARDTIPSMPGIANFDPTARYKAAPASVTTTQSTPDDPFAQLNEKRAAQGLKPLITMPAAQYERWKKRFDEDQPGVLSDIGTALWKGTYETVGNIIPETLAILPGGQYVVDKVNALENWMRGETEGTQTQRHGEEIAKDYSARAKAASQKEWVKETQNEDGSTSYAMGDAWKDPYTYLTQGFESVPATVLTMLPALRLAKVAALAQGEATLAKLVAAGKTLEEATPLAQKAAAAARARTAWIAGSVGEAVVGGSQNSAGTRAELAKVPIETWRQSEAFQGLVKGGLSEEDAIKQLTDDAATKSYLIAGVVDGTFGGLGDRAIAKILGEGVSGPLGKRILKGIAKDVPAEIAEEVPQSAGEQVGSNVAAKGSYDPNRPLTEGVANAAVGGGVIGGIMGAGFGGYSGARSPREAPAAGGSTDPTQPAAGALPPPAGGPAGGRLPPAQAAGTVAGADLPGRKKGALESAVEHGESEAQLQVSREAVAKGAPPTGVTVTVSDPETKASFNGIVTGHSMNGAIQVRDDEGNMHEVPPDMVAPQMRSGKDIDLGPDEYAAGAPQGGPPDGGAGPAGTGQPPAPDAATAASLTPEEQDTRDLLDYAGIKYDEFDALSERDPEAANKLLQTIGRKRTVDQAKPKAAPAAKSPTSAQEAPARKSPTSLQGAQREVLTRNRVPITVTFPSERHASLVDLGTARAGVKLHEQRDTVATELQTQLAEQMKVSFKQAGLLADDYFVDARNAATSGKPAGQVNQQKLRQFRAEHAKAQAASTPAKEPATAASPASPPRTGAAVAPLSAKEVTAALAKKGKTFEQLKKEVGATELFYGQWTDEEKAMAAGILSDKPQGKGAPVIAGKVDPKFPFFRRGGRVITMMDIGGIQVPFYISTGSGGKKDVKAGKWYPFFGIGTDDGWFNKGSQAQINQYYGNPLLRAAAEELDAKWGDIQERAKKEAPPASDLSRFGDKMAKAFPGQLVIDTGPLFAHLPNADNDGHAPKKIGAFIDTLPRQASSPSAKPSEPAAAGATAAAAETKRPAEGWEKWWDDTLTNAGRQYMLKMAKVKRAAATLWRNLPVNLQSKVAEEYGPYGELAESASKVEKTKTKRFKMPTWRELSDEVDAKLDAEEAAAAAAAITPIDPRKVPDPTNDKPLAHDPENTLVLLACSATKLQSSHEMPLLDRYDGPYWKDLRKNGTAIPDANKFALSGKFGFVPATELTANYDEQISPAKVDALITRGVTEAPHPTKKSPLELTKRDKPYTQVIIHAPGFYGPGFNAIVTQLQQAGVIAADAPVRATEGGLPQARKAFNEFLRTATTGTPDKAPAAPSKAAAAAEPFDASKTALAQKMKPAAAKTAALVEQRVEYYRSQNDDVSEVISSLRESIADAQKAVDRGYQAAKNQGDIDFWQAIIDGLSKPVAAATTEQPSGWKATDRVSWTTPTGGKFTGTVVETPRKGQSTVVVRADNQPAGVQDTHLAQNVPVRINAPEQTAPEHARAVPGKALDETNVYEPTATGESRMFGSLDPSVDNLPVALDDFKEITDEWAALFEAPGDKRVNMDRVAKEHGLIEPEAAAKIVEGWQEAAAAQHPANGGKNDNSSKTILSLFDFTGEWSRPYEEAGYNVIRFDIKNGQDVFDLSVEWFNENTDISDVYGILCAPPCTDFANSGNRHKALKRQDGRVEASKELVFQALRTIEYFRPKFWVLENPVGEIEKMTGLPPARMTFNPWVFGDPYTKKTVLWGNFNTDLPVAPVDPVEGSKMWKRYGGKSEKTKAARSETPTGFAYSFFMANNFELADAIERTVADYPEASGAVRAAMEAGLTEDEVRAIMYETYENYEYEEARTELARATAALNTAKAEGGTREPTKSEQKKAASDEAFEASQEQARQRAEASKAAVTPAVDIDQLMEEYVRIGLDIQKANARIEELSYGRGKGAKHQAEIDQLTKQASGWSHEQGALMRQLPVEQRDGMAREAWRRQQEKDQSAIAQRKAAGVPETARPLKPPQAKAAREASRSAAVAELEALAEAAPAKEKPWREPMREAMHKAGFAIRVTEDKDGKSVESGSGVDFRTGWIEALRDEKYPPSASKSRIAGHNAGAKWRKANPERTDTVQWVLSVGSSRGHTTTFNVGNDAETIREFAGRIGKLPLVHFEEATGVKASPATKAATPTPAAPPVGQPAGQPGQGGERPVAPKPKKLSKKAQERADREAAVADYFTPGNVVQGYGGLDRVISYHPPTDTEHWGVVVERVAKNADGTYSRDTKDVSGGRARSHATMPSTRDLKIGPVKRATPESSLMPTAEALAEPAKKAEPAAAAAEMTPDEVADTIKQAVKFERLARENDKMIAAIDAGGPEPTSITGNTLSRDYLVQGAERWRTSAAEYLEKIPEARRQAAKDDVARQLAPKLDEANAPAPRAIPRDTGPDKSHHVGQYVDFGIDNFEKGAEPGDAAMRAVKQRGDRSGKESLIILDENGDAIANGEGNDKSSGMTTRIAAIMADPNEDLILHHNHPMPAGLSEGDIAVPIRMSGLRAVYAHATDGASYRAEPREVARKAWNTFDRDHIIDLIKFRSKPLLDAVVELLKADAAIGGSYSTPQGRRFLNIEFYHLQALAMDEAGLIDYDVVGRSRDSVLLDIPEVREGYDESVRKFRRVVARYSAGAGQRTRSIRHAGDLSVFRYRDGEAAAQQAAEQPDQASAGQPARRSGAAEGQVEAPTVPPQPGPPPARSRRVTWLDTLLRPLTVKPSGGSKGKTIKTIDVAQAFHDEHMKRVGRQLFPERSNADYRHVIELARREMHSQMAEENSGVGWYGPDVQRALDLTSHVFPSLLTTPEHTDLFLTFAGIFSTGTDPEQAWGKAAEAFEYYIQTGEIPVKRLKPDGTPVEMTTFKSNKTGKMVTQPVGWSMRSAGIEQQLELIKRLVAREGGVRQAMDWLNKPDQPKSEINKVMEEAGYSNLRYTKGEAASGTEWGMIVLGDKLGRYALGLHSMAEAETDTTVDLWFTRSYRRWTGRLFEAPIGDQGIAAQPSPNDNGAERKAYFRLTGQLAREFNLPIGDVQAVLWFFEKRLWGVHGLQTRQGTSSSGAERLLGKRGIPFRAGSSEAGVLPVSQDAVRPRGRRGGGTTEAELDQLDAPILTPQIRRQMRDSKVVDEDGDPLPVYHGTTGDFSAFDPNRVGENTGHSTAGLGFWFSVDPAIANMFAGETWDMTSYPATRAHAQGANLMPVYLNIKHPFKMTAREFKDMVTNRGEFAYLKDYDSDGRAEMIERFQKKLISQGYDGVHIEGDTLLGESLSGDEYAADAWVAFRPNQIKSVHNLAPTGRLDVLDAPNLEDVREFGSDVAGLFKRGTKRVASAVRNPKQEDFVGRLKSVWSKLTPHALGAVYLNYLPDLAPDVVKGKIVSYIEKKQAMDTMRKAAHDTTDGTLKKWLKYNRLGPARATELAMFMHDSTIAGVDADDLADMQHPLYATMRARFLAMPEAGRDLYREVRDAYEGQSRLLDTTIEDNVRKSFEIAERQAARDRARELGHAQLMHQRGNMTAVDLAAKTAELNANGARSRLMSRTRAAYAVAQLRQRMESNKVKKPYFPLGRFGKYYVAVRNSHEQLVHFTLAENKFEMKKNKRDAERAFTSAGGFTVSTGLLDEKSRDSIKGLKPAFIAELDKIIPETADKASIMDQIWQRYLKSEMPELSARSHQIHRKRIEGYSDDALKVFANYMFHAGHQTAKLEHGLELADLVDEARLAAQEGPEDQNILATQIVDELQKRHAWVMNPKGGGVAQLASTGAFAFYLAASPGAAMVNLAQTPMVGIPVLGGRFGSMAKAAQQIARAGRNMVTSTGLNDAEKLAMQEFEKTGLIDRTQSMDIAEVGEAGTNYSPVRNKVMNMLSFMFHKAEVLNRRVTALAAYRMAIDSGELHAQAIKTASDMTWKVHFDLSNSSRPRMMQGATGKILFSMRSYQVNMLYRLGYDIYRSFKGASPEERKEARYQLAGLIGMQALFAGTSGVAGYHAIMGVFGILSTLYSAIFGGGDDEDDPFTLQEHYEQYVLSMLGPILGNIVLHGVVGTATQTDLASRVGMPDLWFHSPGNDVETAKDTYLFYLEQIVGAPLGIVAKAFGALDQPSIERSFEAASPKFITDLAKSYRYLTEGVTTKAGGTVIAQDDVGWWSIIATAAGFTPAHIAEKWDQTAMLKGAENRVKVNRQAYINSFQMAVINRNDEARRDALAKIRKYNQSEFGRTMPIKSSTLSGAVKSHAIGEAKRERGDGILIQNERLSRVLREQMAQ